VLAILAGAASGLSDLVPASGPVSGAGKTLNFDKAFHQPLFAVN
jgi:hypothetical protein